MGETGGCDSFRSSRDSRRNRTYGPFSSAGPEQIYHGPDRSCERRMAQLVRRKNQMYGWRAKIGHVAPSRGDTLVYEFYKMLPEGFMLLNSTGTIRQLVDADFERQLQRIEEAAADLVDNKCDAIIVGGSPLFTKLGHGSDAEMGKKLTDKFGVPVSPGITGEIEALKSLNIKKLVVATPHEESLNQRMKAFLKLP